ncbi:hypothetical protein ACUXMM_000610 [Micrococcus aloeverae]
MLQGDGLVFASTVRLSDCNRLSACWWVVEVF